MSVVPKFCSTSNFSSVNVNRILLVYCRLRTQLTFISLILKSQLQFPFLMEQFFVFVKRPRRLVTAVAFSALFAVFVLLSSPHKSFAQDFSNFSGTVDNFSSGLESLLPSFKLVNGSYSNPDHGFEIIFPQGWAGTEISVPFGKVVSAGSLDIAMNTSEFSAMNILFLDNRNNTASEAIANLFNLTDTPTVATVQDPVNMEGSQCDPPSFAPVTINGIKGEQVSYKCEDIPVGPKSNMSVKTKGLTFVTNDDSLIFVSFTASPDVFDQDIPKFEESIKTVKISNPGDISNSPTYNEFKKLLMRQAL